MSEEGRPRTDRRRGPSALRQAVEGIVLVAVLALAAVAFGALAALVVSWAV